MLKPQKVDLTIYQGASLKRAWQIVRKGTPNPIDLSGYKARMQIRAKLKDESPILDLTTENGGITIMVTEEDTTISIYASAEATAAITAKKGVYDMEVIDTAGDVYRLMEGAVEVSQEVTR